MTEKSAAVGVSKQAQQLKELIAKGKEQGYLTYKEVNDHLPNDIVDPEQIEDIVNMINDMGIAVHENAPDPESLILSDAAATDEDAAEDVRPVAVAGEGERAAGVGCGKAQHRHTNGQNDPVPHVPSPSPATLGRRRATLSTPLRGTRSFSEATHRPSIMR